MWVLKALWIIEGFISENAQWKIENSFQKQQYDIEIVFSEIALWEIESLFSEIALLDIKLVIPIPNHMFCTFLICIL